MNKRYIVVGFAAAMVGVIAAAFALDCVRLAEAARHRVELADHELAKHEQRLARLLAGSPAVSPAVRAAIAAHDAAATLPCATPHTRNSSQPSDKPWSLKLTPQTRWPVNSWTTWQAPSIGGKWPSRRMTPRSMHIAAT